VSKVIPFPKIYRPGAPRTKMGAFLARLGRLPEFARSGYQIQRAGISEIAIAHNDHVLGVWRIVDGCYLYTPTSYREPTFESDDLAEAARHVRELLRSAERASNVERRRNKRWRVQCSAVLCMPNHKIDVMIEDVSVGGLMIRMGDDLSFSEPLVVEVYSHDRLEATIAWIQCGSLGAIWRHPLSPGHALLTVAEAAP
jgi:PilZ domain